MELKNGVWARAKTAIIKGAPYPIWVMGEYTTSPPSKPTGQSVRPSGHYIDKGGYPGANVYRIDPSTLCAYTGQTDKAAEPIFEQDYLLCGSPTNYRYLLITSRDKAIDVLTGDEFAVSDLPAEEIQVIGNRIDDPDLVDGLRNLKAHNQQLPYIPTLHPQDSSGPYFLLSCAGCGARVISSRYAFRCPYCGSPVVIGYTTDIKK